MRRKNINDDRAAKEKKQAGPSGKNSDELLAIQSERSDEELDLLGDAKTRKEDFHMIEHLDEERGKPGEPMGRHDGTAHKLKVESTEAAASDVIIDAASSEASA